MVKLGFSFGKFGRDYGYQDGVAMDSVPLISPLDVSQLQPPYSDQVSGLGQRWWWWGGGLLLSLRWEQRDAERDLFRYGLLQGAGGQAEEGLAGWKPRATCNQLPHPPVLPCPHL